MIRRLFVLGTMLGCLLLWPCPQVWAKSPKMPVKSLIRVANPGALAMPEMPMPTTIPNNYNSTVTESFDSNLGSKGTLYLNYQFTGTTQQNPMCSNPNAHHFPEVSVTVVKNGTRNNPHSTSGSFVAPCVQMNQTLTLGIDIGLEGCDLTMFFSGVCELSEDTDQVVCTIMGDFAFLLKNWQFESATTVSQVVDGTPGAYFLEPYCAASSDPPDWFGPFGSDTYGTGYFVATEVMIRWQIFGKSFYGVPWKPISPVGPAGQWSAGPKPICTMADHGCSFVDQTCTAKAIPQSLPGQPDAILKRRDA